MAGAKLKVRRHPGRPITNNSPRARARRVARRALTASGICGCGAPADRGVQCEARSARNAESLRVLAVTRKAAGLCREFGWPSQGRARCMTCVLKRGLRPSRSRKHRKAENVARRARRAAARAASRRPTTHHQE